MTMANPEKHREKNVITRTTSSHHPDMKGREDMNDGKENLAFNTPADRSIDRAVQLGTKAVELHEGVADGHTAFDTAAGDVIADVLWAVYEGEEGTLDWAQGLLDQALRYYAQEIREDSKTIAARHAQGRVRDKSNDDRNQE
jgi:hypothetical protein